MGIMTMNEFREGDVKGQEIHQINTLTGGQREYLDNITSLMNSQIGQGITPFGGTRPGEVGFSPLQQQGLGMMGGLTPGIGQGFAGFSGFDPSQGQGFMDQSQGALNQGLQGFDSDRIMAALEPGRRLAMNQFEQQTVPDLLERFGASSGSSGSLNQAMAGAASGLSLGLGAQAAPYLGQAALAAPGNQFQGAQLAGNMAALPGQLAQQGLGLGTAGMQQLMQAGGMQQGLQQGIAGANQARFGEAQAYNNPWLSAFGDQALGTRTSENIAFQGYREPSHLEASGKGMENMSTGMAMGMSDERMKEDIEPIENALDKVKKLDGKTYHFKHELDGNNDAGVIAQDVEAVIPEGVIENNGIKYVKYSALIGLLVNATKEMSAKIEELERKAG